MATSFLLQQSPSPGCSYWHLVLEPSQWPWCQAYPQLVSARGLVAQLRVGLFSFPSQQIFHPAISDLPLFNSVFVLNYAGSLNSPAKNSKMQINFKSPII